MKTIIAILLLAACSARAQLIESFSGGDALSVGPGTAGFEFTVGASPLSVAALGIWDDSGTGLSNAHTVGIWDASRALVASVTVTPGSSVDRNGFWYVNLAAPLTLSVGGHYTIGARYADSDFDFARGNVPSVTSDPRVSLGPPVLSTGSGFEFPDLELPQAGAGFFGPNAAFVAVPEPASALVVALLLLAMPLTAGASKARKGELAHARRQQPRIEEVEQPPATNRPPVTPGNVNGNRPVIPPGLEKQNYATP